MCLHNEPPSSVKSFQTKLELDSMWPRYQTFELHSPALFLVTQEDTVISVEVTVKQHQWFESSKNTPKSTKVITCICEVDTMQWELMASSITEATDRGLLTAKLPKSERTYAVIFGTLPAITQDLSIHLQSDVPVEITKVDCCSGVQVIQVRLSTQT